MARRPRAGRRHAPGRSIAMATGLSSAAARPSRPRAAPNVRPRPRPRCRCSATGTISASIAGMASSAVSPSRMRQARRKPTRRGDRREQHRERCLGRHRLSRQGQRGTARSAQPRARVPARQATRTADAGAHIARQRHTRPGAQPGRARVRHREASHGPGRAQHRPGSRNRAHHARQPGQKHAPPGLDRGERCARPIGHAVGKARRPNRSAPRRRENGTPARAAALNGSHRHPASPLFEVSTRWDW